MTDEQQYSVTPERIWLIDQGPDGCVWCDDPNPAGEADAPDAVEYVRAGKAETLREAAKEFFNATVASQQHSPGFSPIRCVQVAATHPDLRDRVNRAADALERALEDQSHDR